MASTQQLLASYGSPFVGPLDDYSALLTGAWSVVRRLLTSYDGPLVRLRRTSDSVESDFGALTNGRLDESAVNTFLGGAGMVVKVYDQYGANDRYQSSASVQPVWAPTLADFNGAPSLYLGTTGGMLCDLNVTRPYSILLTECNPDAATLFGQRTLDSNGGNRLISSSRADAGQCYDGVTVAPVLQTAAAVVELLTAPASGAYVFYNNATDVTTGTPTAQDWGQTLLGKSGVNGEVGRSYVAELVTFNLKLDQTQATALQAIFNPATL